MAKRTTRRYSESRDLTKFCAFWGVVIAAFMYIFSGLLNLLIKFVDSIKASKSASVMSNIASVATLLGNIALIIAIAIPAYGYVRGKSKGWKVCYWLAIIVYAFGVVFGMLSAFRT